MRVLVVEDDADLNRQLSEALKEAGYVVDSASDGEEGHFLGDTEPYDAVVLDIGLPVLDGISRAGEMAARRPQRCRCSSSPRATAGATRCRASTPAPTTMSPSPSTSRRCWPASARWCAAPPAMPPTRSRCGPVRLDSRAGRVTVDGNPVKLTSHEYRVLEYLMHHRDRVVSRTELIEHLYDQDFDRDSNTIEVFVGRLRKKVSPDLIETVRGLGYRIVDAGQPCGS